VKIQIRRKFAAVLLGLALSLFAVHAKAETGDINIHLELGPGFVVTGWQMNGLDPGLFGAARLEYAFLEWMGVEAGLGYLNFFNGSLPEGYEKIDGAYILSIPVGFRFRPLNDEKGYLWDWSGTNDPEGNAWSNLWIDVHGDYYRTGNLNRGGVDLGVGAEFSLVTYLQVGPFIRGMYVYQPDSVNTRASNDALIILAGVSASIAIPPGKKWRDTDGDGIFDSTDQCIYDPEDKDGFQDQDGCPDPDNDNDKV